MHDNARDTEDRIGILLDAVQQLHERTVENQQLLQATVKTCAALLQILESPEALKEKKQ